MAKSKKKIKTVVTRTPIELAKALDLDDSVVLEWQVRIELTKKIQEVFSSQDITMTELAKRANTSLARISRMLKGDTVEISLEFLFRILGILGQHVKLSFSKAS
jgi:ParB-like chromosome segregation protein Spo0J